VVSGGGFDVAAGEVVALVGGSGCGEAVTALSIRRLVPRPGQIAAGRVRLCGKDVLSLPVDEMRRVRGSDAAMSFQAPLTRLNPGVAVGGEVVEPIRLHERVSAAEARRRTIALFE